MTTTTTIGKNQLELERLAEDLERQMVRELEGKNCQAVGLALANVVARWLASHQQGSEARLMEVFRGMVMHGVPRIRELNWEHIAKQHPSASTPQ